MKRYYIVITILLISLLAITGCGADENKIDDSQEKDKQLEVQGADSDENFWNDEMFLGASLDDLEIGQRALVMGMENDGGSANALRIIIGDKDADFENMAMGMRTIIDERDIEDKQQAQPNFAGGNPRSGGEMPNFELFQNMSEEERAKFREEMKAEREAGVPKKTDMNQNMVRFVGEIINKDEKTLTLKLEDTGSKLIFYSEETIILKIKE